MAIGGKREGSGRPKGSRNKSTTEAQAYVDKVFALIDPIKLAHDLMICGQPAVTAKVWQTLIEYRYGKAAQLLELTGKEGADPIAVTIVHVGSAGAD